MRPELAVRLATEFPELEVIVNGGAASVADAVELCQPPLRGVMVGRAVRDRPYLWSAVTGSWSQSSGGGGAPHSRREILEAYLEYAATFGDNTLSEGALQCLRVDLLVPLLNLFAGEPGNAQWREALVRWISECGPVTLERLRALVRCAVAPLHEDALDRRGVGVRDTTMHGETRSDHLLYSNPGLRLVSMAGAEQGHRGGLHVSALESLAEGSLLLAWTPRGLPEEEAQGLVGRSPNCVVKRAATEKDACHLANLPPEGCPVLPVHAICLLASRDIHAGDRIIVARSAAALAVQDLLGGGSKC